MSKLDQTKNAPKDIAKGKNNNNKNSKKMREV